MVKSVCRDLFLITLLPPVAMCVLQIFLQFHVISRALALISPYAYFLLIALVCLSPSICILVARRKALNLNPGQIAMLVAGAAIYTPILWLEYFYTACILFDDCHKL